MSVKVVELKPATPTPAPLAAFAQRLRDLATMAEEGRLVDAVFVGVLDGRYAFCWPSSDEKSLVLTSLAHHAAIERMKAS